MPYEVGKLDQKQRAAEKQASRDRDRARLESGEVSKNDLKRENGFFSALGINNWKIVGIGGKPFKRKKP